MTHTYTVVVSNPEGVKVTNISLNSSSETIGVGETKQLTATVYPNDATNKTVTWSSNNTNVATVSSSGLVTAKAAGTATITCKANDGSGVKATCSVTVKKYVSSISLNTSSETLEVGKTKQLTAMVNPSDATDKSVTWSSSDTGVASVSSSGLMTAKAAGTATITCKANDGSGISVSCKVMVTNVMMDLLEIAPKMVTAGASHSLILKMDGTLWACGNNGYGQLGDGTTTNQTTPVLVMSDVASVAAGSDHSLILKTDGTLWACGLNNSGQLGDRTNINRRTPVQVMSDVASMAAGYSHSLILKTNGTLWACGSNNLGQLGDGTTTNRTTPVLVMSNVASVSAGCFHSLILKTDGTLWACGADGTLTFAEQEIPVQVMSDVVSMAAGNDCSLILKTNGTLWACGDNGYGQLGDGTTTTQITPVQVMGDVASMAVGYHHSLILKTDGTLLACGSNSYGQLGDGTSKTRTTPVPVMSNVASMAAGNNHSLILKTDGTLWACGSNRYGQLGDGTEVDKYTPTLIMEKEILEDTDVSELDNLIYIDKTQVYRGLSQRLSIKMKNSVPVCGFQFNLYLPDGVKAVKNSKGRIMASLSSERLDADDEHMLTTSEQDDGSILFLCGSLYEETFTGNDGEIATIRISVSRDVPEGDCPVLLKDIKLTETDISKYYETDLVKTSLTVSSCIMGDINGDGKVDVSDYIGVANHILGHTPEGFNEVAGDVDQNGTIDVSDYLGVGNIIHTGSVYGSSKSISKIRMKDNKEE